MLKTLKVSYYKEKNVHMRTLAGKRRYEVSSIQEHDGRSASRCHVNMAAPARSVTGSSQEYLCARKHGQCDNVPTIEDSESATVSCNMRLIRPHCYC